MYPILLTVLFAVFSPEPLVNTPPPDQFQTINESWHTHIEGWDRVMSVEVETLPTLAASDPYRGMGDDVEQWRPLVESHFGDLGADAVNQALRIMACESNGNPSARNPRSTATGLMQIMASIWGDHFGYSRADLEVPELNLWVAREVYNAQGWNAWTCWRR